MKKRHHPDLRVARRCSSMVIGGALLAATPWPALAQGSYYTDTGVSSVIIDSSTVGDMGYADTPGPVGTYEQTPGAPLPGTDGRRLLMPGATPPRSQLHVILTPPSQRASQPRVASPAPTSRPVLTAPQPPRATPPVAVSRAVPAPPPTRTAPAPAKEPMAISRAVPPPPVPPKAAPTTKPTATAMAKPEPAPKPAPKPAATAMAKPETKPAPAATPPAPPKTKAEPATELATAAEKAATPAKPASDPAEMRAKADAALASSVRPSSALTPPPKPAPAPAAPVQTASAPPPPPKVEEPPVPVVKPAETKQPTETAARTSGPGSLSPGTAMKVTFAGEASKLPNDSKNGLKALADRLEQSKDLRLQLLAYAGGEALSASKARRISLSRALSVRSYLIESGLRSTRIDVRALGDKTTEEPLNRVDVVVIER